MDILSQRTTEGQEVAILKATDTRTTPVRNSPTKKRGD